MKILQKNDEIIQKRIEDYNKKQIKILERQKMQEEELKKKMEEKHYELIQKEKRTEETRIRNEKLKEKNREELIKKINSSQERILKQKELNKREAQERFIELSIKQEDIEENLRMNENLKEYERMKKLAEIEERNRRIEGIKLQKIKIFEERRKMNRTLENEKEYLLTRFNEIMNQKGRQNKSKEELMNQLFNEDIHSSTKYKTMQKNKSSIDVFKSGSKSKNNSGEYNDFEKSDNFFVTNMKKVD